MSLGKNDLEAALRNPAEMFPAPEAVAADSELTRDQKIEILRQWAYDAAESEVATEEGMPGAGPVPLQRVLLELERLGVAADAAGSGPTKQHPRLRKRR